MHYINRDDLDNYRYAIAKECFLRNYPEYRLLDDIPNSNCMRVKRSNSSAPEVVSIFRRPTIEIEENVAVIAFYQKGKYKQAREKQDKEQEQIINNLYIDVLSDSFTREYDESFREAILHPDSYLSIIQGKEKEMVVKYLDKYDEKDETVWYKYYSQEKVANNGYGINDGSISFVDPNEFNDPFDVNCFFASGQDISDRFRIFCVSPSPAKILMWSYYGTDHKGYCFGYRGNDILQAIRRLKGDGLCIIGDVRYERNRPIIRSKLNYLSYSELSFYVNACLTKYKDWEHEAEHRFVLISDAFVSSDKYISTNINIEKAYMGCKGQSTLPIKDSSGKIIATTKLVKHPTEYELI